jgi:hypothetical protein
VAEGPVHSCRFDATQGRYPRTGIFTVTGTVQQLVATCANEICWCEDDIPGTRRGTLPAAAPAAEAPKPAAGPAKTIYCRYSTQDVIINSRGKQMSMLMRHELTQTGSAEEVKASCEAQFHVSCTCSDDRAYFDSARTCSDIGAACINASDCCSGQCTDDACVSL